MPRCARRSSADWWRVRKCRWRYARIAATVGQRIAIHRDQVGDISVLQHVTAVIKGGVQIALTR